MSSKFYYGSHMTVSKGIPWAINQIEKEGANFIQVFISNPRSGRFIPKNEQDIQKLKETLLNKDVKFVIHSPYVLNFSKIFNESNWWYQTLIQELEFADQFDECIGSVLHFGKALKFSLDDAYDNFIKSVQYVVDNTTNKSKILIETSSGQGTEICHKIEDFAILWNMFPDEYKERLGICIDTCHIFAAGHNISNPEGVKEYFDKFDKLIGKKYISLIHFNDSKKDVGTRVDRHENIGLGYIGLEALKSVVEYSNTNKIPLVLETPGDGHKEELILIKSWIYKKINSNLCFDL
ncbi:Xylose isomerase-like TIM barrel [seawater metagenome]|uniref:Xylose isomerase-like TIM barrel n=1 Tax=seawater metagenome TaxID=1561972 RepID=A0A5E8CMD9_9ZZZZ